MQEGRWCGAAATLNRGPALSGDGAAPEKMRGHEATSDLCPLSAVKRTWLERAVMSAKCQERSKDYGVIAAPAYCGLRFVLPKLISGLRRPIAIQAAISFNMNLPE